MTRHEEYDEFMKQYELLHECCPKCGETSHMTTLVGYILDLSKKEEYKDLNRCTCESCGDVHKTHDRVPKKDKQKVQEKINAIIELAKTKGTKVDWTNHKKVETSLSNVIKTQEQADFFMMCLEALTKKKKIEPLEDGSTGQPDWDWNNSAMCLKCHQKFSFEDIEEHKNECEK